MCNTCNNTGGLNTEHSWGISFHPCPSTNCSFDRDKAWKETLATMERIEQEMKLSDIA